MSSSSNDFGKLVFISKTEISKDLCLGPTRIGFDVNADVRLLSKAGRDLYCIVDVDENGIATITSNFQKLTINGVPLKKPSVLKHLDMIVLGETKMKIQYINEKQKNIAAASSKIPRIKRKSLGTIQHHTPLKTKTPAKKAGQAPCTSSSLVRTPRATRRLPLLQEKSKTTSKLNHLKTPTKNSAKRLSLTSTRASKPGPKISSRNILLSTKKVAAGKFGQSPSVLSRKAALVAEDQVNSGEKCTERSQADQIIVSPSPLVLDPKYRSTFSSSSTDLNLSSGSSVSPVHYSVDSFKMQKTSESDTDKTGTSHIKGKRNQKSLSGEFIVDLKKTVTPSVSNTPAEHTSPVLKGLSLELYEDSEVETLKENVSSNLRKRPRESTATPLIAKKRRLEAPDTPSRTFGSSSNGFSTDSVLSELNRCAAARIDEPDLGSLIDKPIINDPQLRKLRKKSPKSASVKKSKTTKNVQKKPKNNLSDVSGVRKLLSTPKAQKSPKNDLSNVTGLKKLLKTPRSQKTPKNDLSNVSGVKDLLSTPQVQNSPRGDVGIVNLLTKSVRTPGVRKTPKNDLSGISGVRKLLSTPKAQKSPKNDPSNNCTQDLTVLKKLEKTPRVQKTPKNDLSDVSGIEDLLSTPKVQNSPRGDVGHVNLLKKSLRTSQVQKTPVIDNSDVGGVKDLLCTPNAQKSLKKSQQTPQVQKTPKIDLSNISGVKDLRSTAKVQNSPISDMGNVDSVKKSMRTPQLQKTPEIDYSDFGGVENLVSTPSAQKSSMKKSQVQKTPKNDPSDVSDVKDLLSTPQVQNSSGGDVGNVNLLKTSGRTPQLQNTPEIENSDVGGAENLLSTPNKQNSSMKKSEQTPRVQKTPKNELSSLYDVQNLFSTTNTERSPMSSNITRFKKSMQAFEGKKTPTVGSVRSSSRSPDSQMSPTNNLSSVSRDKMSMNTPEGKIDPSEVSKCSEFLSTPELLEIPDVNRDVSGLEVSMRTLRSSKTPKNDLSEVKNIEDLSKTSKIENTPRKLVSTSKTPKSDLQAGTAATMTLRSTPGSQETPKLNLSSIVLSDEEVRKTLTLQETPKRSSFISAGTKKSIDTPQKQITSLKVVQALAVQEIVTMDNPTSTEELSNTTPRSFKIDVNAVSEEATPTVEKIRRSCSTGVEQFMNTPKSHQSFMTDFTHTTKKSPRTRRMQKSPKNDITVVAGVKKLMSTPKVPKSPKNDLTNVAGVKKLMSTPVVRKSPRNDLTNVAGVKKLMSTPLVQKSPRNDLTNIAGVKKLMSTPLVQKSPRNDLTNVAGVKKLMSTPLVQKSPRNDLTNVAGVKKLMSTPVVGKSPRNDLTNVAGVKKLMSTPKVPKSPSNNLSDVSGVEKLFSTPKVQRFSRHDFSDVPNVEELMRTPTVPKLFKYDLNISGVKQITGTPTTRELPTICITDDTGEQKSMRTKKSPENNLSNQDAMSGVNIQDTSVNNSSLEDLVVSVDSSSRITSSESSQDNLPACSGFQVTSTPITRKLHKLSSNSDSEHSDVDGKLTTNHSPIQTINDVNEESAVVEDTINSSKSKSLELDENQDDRDLFAKLFHKKPLKTYRGKSMSPEKEIHLHSFPSRKTLGGVPDVSPRVRQWVEEHKLLMRDQKGNEQENMEIEDLPVIDTGDLESNETAEKEVLPSEGGIGRNTRRRAKQNDSIDTNETSARSGKAGTNRKATRQRQTKEREGSNEGSVVQLPAEVVGGRVTRQRRSKSKNREQIHEDGNNDIRSITVKTRSTRQRSGKQQNEAMVHGKEMEENAGVNKNSSSPEGTRISTEVESIRVTRQRRGKNKNGAQVQAKDSEGDGSDDSSISVETKVTKSTRQHSGKQQNEAMVHGKEMEENAGVNKNSSSPEGTRISTEVESIRVTRQRRGKNKNGAQVQAKDSEGDGSDDSSISVETKVTKSTRQHSGKQQNEAMVHGKEMEENAGVNKNSSSPEGTRISTEVESIRVTRQRRGKNKNGAQVQAKDSEGDGSDDSSISVETKVTKSTRQHSGKQQNEAMVHGKEMEENAGVNKNSSSPEGTRISTEVESVRVTRQRRGKNKNGAQVQEKDSEGDGNDVNSSSVETKVTKSTKQHSGKQNEAAVQEKGIEENSVLKEKKSVHTAHNKRATRKRQAEDLAPNIEHSGEEDTSASEGVKVTRQLRRRKQSEDIQQENRPTDDALEQTAVKKKLTRRRKTDEQEAGRVEPSTAVETKTVRATRQRKDKKQLKSQVEEIEETVEKKKGTRRDKAEEQAKGTKTNTTEDKANRSEENLAILAETAEKVESRRGKLEQPVEALTAKSKDTSAVVESETVKPTRQRRGAKQLKSEDKENVPEEKLPVSTEDKINKTTEKRKVPRRGKADRQTTEPTATMPSPPVETDREENPSVLTENETNKTTKRVTRRGKSEEEAKVSTTRTATQRRGQRTKQDKADAEDKETEAAEEDQAPRLTRSRVQLVTDVEDKTSPVSTKRSWKEDPGSASQRVKHVHWDEAVQHKAGTRLRGRRTKGTT